MNSHRNVLRGTWAIWILAVFLPFPSSAIINAVRDLQETVDRAQASSLTNPAVSAELTAKLKIAIETISEGNAVVSNLNGQVAALEKEKAELQQIQSGLTSGLIGAVVTAIVALAGLFFKTKNSKVDRDLKRLEVAEKMSELAGKGIALPPDIVKAYKPGKGT